MRHRRGVSSIALGVLLVAVVPLAAGASARGRPSHRLAGSSCELIAVPAAGALPVGATPCGGVRPGAVVKTPIGLCSLNFLFTATDGRRYIGTAGHCIIDENGGGSRERSWAPGTGPVATDAGGSRIGEFAYGVLSDPRDISLIRLDAGVDASPQMCHFGGPTGLNGDRSSGPVLLQHYGNGLVAGSAVPARTALALSMPDADAVWAIGLATPGDSGSGIISADGRAVGVVVALGAATGADPGNVAITRLGPQVARAEEVLGISLTLRTAPQL